MVKLTDNFEDIEPALKSNSAKAPRTADPATFWIWLIGMAAGATGTVRSCRPGKKRSSRKGAL